MKLIMSKIDEDIKVQVEKDGNIVDFDYIDFVDNIYYGEKIKDISFEKINDWEQTALNEIINKINSIVSNDEQQDSKEETLEVQIDDLGI